MTLNMTKFVFFMYNLNEFDIIQIGQFWLSSIIEKSITEKCVTAVVIVVFLKFKMAANENALTRSIFELGICSLHKNGVEFDQD